jgi:hypothetical protein
MLNEYFLGDDFQAAKTVEEGLVRSIGFLNRFRPFFDCIAGIGHNSILATILMSLLNTPFEQGKETFNLKGNVPRFALRLDTGRPELAGNRFVHNRKYRKCR